MYTYILGGSDAVVRHERHRFAAAHIETAADVDAAEGHLVAGDLGRLKEKQPMNEGCRQLEARHRCNLGELFLVEPSQLFER